MLRVKTFGPSFFLAIAGNRLRHCGEVEGIGGEVKGGRLVGEGVPLMLATWMRFWLLPSRVSCVLLCPFLLLLLHLCCILLLLVDLS